MDPLSFQTLLEEIRPHAQSMLSHFLIFIFSLSTQPLFRWPSNVKLRRLFARTLKSTLPDQESHFSNFFFDGPVGTILQDDTSSRSYQRILRHIHGRRVQYTLFYHSTDAYVVQNSCVSDWTATWGTLRRFTSNRIR